MSQASILVPSWQSRETREVLKNVLPSLVLPSLFFLPCFFSALVLFFIKSFSRSQLPFLSQRKKLKKPRRAFVRLHGKDVFFLFFFFNSAALSGLETFHCGQDAESVPEILASLNRKCVETFSHLFYLPLRRSTGAKRWRPGRWCVPCSSSSPASPRSCRSSRATSSRCSASWMSSGCWATRTASQVKPLGSAAHCPNSFVQPELASKNHTVFWGR